MNATQFPRMYQHIMLIPWNKFLSCRVNRDGSLHTLNHDTPCSQEIRQAGWFWKIFLIRKQPTPKVSLDLKVICDLVRCMQTHYARNLHGHFTAYKHAFIWSARQYCKMDWENIASSTFMSQKIRSKNDRFPQGGRNRKKIQSTRLLFLTTLI